MSQRGHNAGDDGRGGLDDRRARRGRRDRGREEDDGERRDRVHLELDGPRRPLSAQRRDEGMSEETTTPNQPQQQGGRAPFASSTPTARCEQTASMLEVADDFSEGRPYRRRTAETTGEERWTPLVDLRRTCITEESRQRMNSDVVEVESEGGTQCNASRPAPPTRSSGSLVVSDESDLF